ncbi:MAG: hypothetical protein ABIH58_01195 [Patescibacteria group bacterium]
MYNVIVAKGSSRKTKAKEELAVSSSPEKIVPKLCNVMNFAKDKSGNIIMTLVFKDPMGDQSVLLERIIVDSGHAKEIVSVLTKFIKK